MSVYIWISLNFKQGRGSNFSSAVQTSAVSGDKMTGRADRRGNNMGRVSGRQTCIKGLILHHRGAPGVKVVGACLGKRCSRRLPDSRGLASENQSGVGASKRVQPTGLDLGCRAAGLPREIWVRWFDVSWKRRATLRSRLITFDLLRHLDRDHWPTDCNLTEVKVAPLVWGPQFGVPKCDF